MDRRLIVILLVALGLRVALVGGHLLWNDEIYTAQVSELTWGGIVAETSLDVHPPLFYFLTHAAVVAFGKSELALRLPSLLLGLLAIWLTWRLARLAAPGCEALAAGLLAVSSFAVYYSNEARQYNLLMVAVLLATLGAMEKRGWLLSLGVALALLSHNAAAIYLPAMGLLAWGALGFWRAAAWCALGVSPWMAWLAIGGMGQVARVSSGYWIGIFAGNLPASMLYDLGRVLFLRFDLENFVWQYTLVSVALVVFPLAATFRLRHRGALALALVAFLPPLVALAVSVIWTPMILYRTWAGCLPAWLALVAWWAHLPRRWDAPRLALAGAALGFFVIATATYFYVPGRNEARPQLAWLQANLSEDDVLCHIDSVIEYYTARPYLWEPDQCNYILWRDYPPVNEYVTDAQTNFERAIQERGRLVYHDDKPGHPFGARIYKLDGEKWTTR